VGNILKLMTFILLTALPSVGFAENTKFFNFEAFSVYEHASDRIKISNVSTRYGIGAAGFQVTASFIENKLESFVRYGLGYHPNYTLSSFGTEFTGPVNGDLFEYGVKLNTSGFLTNGSSISVIQSNRHVYSDQLTGTRGGVNFTTSTDAMMKSTEVRLSQTIYAKGENSVSVFLGSNSWQLNALGTAYSSNLTAKKNVNGENTDPVWGVSIQSSVFNLPLELGLTHRTINADNRIETFEISGTLRF